ncbi:MAG: LOW QUALITY PROTEIN: uncharacterized protein KVP18_005012 [Porospora cf. gigantea A]|uniref:uncharacterized protein n=1 Tax=Porospora cf. gigantea A TaxID=2853593 RepID=UPI00355ABFDB|nr:MAG: LOW QUALITY PROTEIN: hypothetical protein KVP18_005012 [Porospora cf. gigantea A]
MNLVTDKVPNQVACARIMCESFMEVVCLFDPGSGYFAFGTALQRQIDKDYQGYILKSKFAGEPAPQYSGPFPAIEDLPVFVAASPLRVPGNGPDVLLKPFIFDLKAIMPTVLERDRRSDGTCDAGQQTSLAVCSLVPTCLTAHPPIELQERWIHDVDDAGQTRALLLKKSTCDPSKVHLETTPLGKVKWGKLTLYARYANPDDYDKLEVNLADGAIIVARQQPSKQPAASTSSLTLSPSVSLTMSLSSGPSSLKAEVNGHSYVVHSPRGSVGPSGVAVSPPLVVSILRQFEN